MRGGRNKFHATTAGRRNRCGGRRAARQNLRAAAVSAPGITVARLVARVINHTASPARRASVTFYLGYDEDLGRAFHVVQAAMVRTHGVNAQPPPSMRLREFTPTSLEVEARFWTDSHRTDFMNTASEVRVAILAALLEAGIALPQPDKRTLVPGDPERWRETLSAPQR